MITTASLWFSIQAANDHQNFGKDALKRGENAIYLQARHHLLYTLSIISNFVCVFYYWFEKRDFQQWVHGSQKSEFGPVYGRSIHLELVHSVPAAACIFNSLCTNCILKRDNWRLIPVMVVVYGLFCWLHFLLTDDQDGNLFMDF